MIWSTSFAIVVSGILSVLAWTTIRRSVIETSDSAVGLKPIGVPRFIGALLVVAVAQAVYAIACVRAIICKKLSWRGVTYLVSGKTVVLEEYKPYQETGNSEFSI